MQSLAALQGDSRPLIVQLQGAHPGLTSQLDQPRSLTGAVIRNAAQGVVGHQGAQLAAGLEEQGGAVRAVEDPGPPQRRALGRAQALPGAQALQDGDAALGQGDFAPVLGGLGQRGQGLGLQHPAGDAGIGQQGGQREPDRPGADDQHRGLRGEG